MTVVELSLEAFCHEVGCIYCGVDAKDIDVFLVVPILNRKVLGVHVPTWRRRLVVPVAVTTFLAPSLSQ